MFISQRLALLLIFVLGFVHIAFAPLALLSDRTLCAVLADFVDLYLVVLLLLVL